MSREQLLNRIRQKLKVDASDTARQQAVAARLSAKQSNTLPQRGRKSHPQLVMDFAQRIINAQATVSRVKSLTAVVAEVEKYLSAGSLSCPPNIKLCINGDIEQLALGFEGSGLLNLTPWRANSSMDVCMTACLGAVAESGSLVVTSSGTSAITQHMLADIHIVLLRAGDIVGVFEEIWQKLPRSNLPRDITFISGPSCTGDIEMIMEYGAHGPKALHVIIVGESPADYQPL